MQMFGIILASLIVLPGCELSIDPVISEVDSTFDSRLLGQWEQVSSSDPAVVTSGKDNTYLIEYTNTKETGRFQARLGMLGGRQIDVPVLTGPVIELV
jgi:hypothetical protein